MHSQQIQKQNKKGLLIRRYLENKRIEKVTIRNKKPQHILKILKKRFKIEKDHFLNVGETIFNLFFFFQSLTDQYQIPHFHIGV